jgi:undecaprenyl-diphosphatase
MIFVDAAAANAVLRLPPWIVALFHVITDIGRSGWFLWPLGILFLALACVSPMLTRFSQLVVAAIMVRVAFLFVAIGAPGLFVTMIKRVIGRARPLVNGHIDPFAFSPLAWHAAYASLPSGHATTAFSVLVAFGALWPRGRAVFFIYALLIGASRVILTAHYPTDVFAGAVIGAVGALIVRRWFALRRLGFSIELDGRIHQYPGPSRKRIKAVARELLAE